MRNGTTLVKHVFPELRDWCEQRRIRMMDIDLRWGVTELDATRNANVVQVCLDRIDECRPFFLCLLGQRYGWVPQKVDVPAEALRRFPGLQEAVDAGRSVTELEVLHAVAHPFHREEDAYQAAEWAFFYLREDSYLNDLPADPRSLLRIYSDAAESDPDRRQFLLERQQELRERVLPSTGRPVRRYHARWSGSLKTPELEFPLHCPAALAENVERWRRQWKHDADVNVQGLDVTEDPDEARKGSQYNQKLTAGRLTDFVCGGKSLGEVILNDLT